MTPQEEAWNKFCQEVMPDQNVTYALRGTFGTVFKRAWDEATAVEREACAKVCDDIEAENDSLDVLATVCADAIRARGTK